jgi:hypothetical protein
MGGCEERTIGRMLLFREDLSPEAVTRERLVKIQQAGED